MADFARARQQMVETQLRTSNITDKRLLARMGQVPRELFVPPQRQIAAYADDGHVFGGAGSDQFMPTPAVFAKLAQLAAVAASDTVLDLHVTTGYSTAVFAGLGKHVVAVEEHAGLAAEARANLAALINTSVVDTLAEVSGQFHVIFVGAAQSVSSDLLAKLAEGGRLVVLLRKGAVGLATVHTKTNGHIITRSDFSVALPPNMVSAGPVEFIF